jgi:hypothetical protein
MNNSDYIYKVLKFPLITSLFCVKAAQPAILEAKYSYSKYRKGCAIELIAR